ncbi:hypothetical protein CF133_23165 [Aeromonas salmonicida]|uniref:DUF1439 domain-containing protein n=1 Tax=Aeromonas salmonicida TaxID=645 RepID=UPI0011191569|nr:DUF1439 domain-containing protein [Aeromonas salmonicida]TNI63374.1 hypothetical protein CF133_23165 [Aeromonas salmonicida]
MVLQSLLLSLALLAPGQSEVSEQQLTTLLNQKGQIERQVQMKGLFDARLQLTEGEVELGRQQPGMARVTGRGTATITMGNKPPVDARLFVTLDGKPRYEAQSHALYLDEARVVEYRMEPKEAEQQYCIMVNLLLQSLQQRLQGQPVYRLDGKDARTRWWRDNLNGIEVLPGKLKLTLKETAGKERG